MRPLRCPWHERVRAEIPGRIRCPLLLVLLVLLLLLLLLLLIPGGRGGVGRETPSPLGKSLELIVSSQGGVRPPYSRVPGSESVYMTSGGVPGEDFGVLNSILTVPGGNF